MEKKGVHQNASGFSSVPVTVGAKDYKEVRTFSPVVIWMADGVDKLISADGSWGVDEDTCKDSGNTVEEMSGVMACWIKYLQ